VDFFISIDQSLFWFLNTTTANVLLDKIIPFITERNNWFLLYIFLFFFLVLKLGKDGRVAAILIILAVSLADQTTSSILKPLFERLRPCHELEGVRLLAGCGGKYGFPSSHAANFFAAATLFSIFFPRYKIIYLVIALLVAYSRIYVGVHYPSDVIVGSFVGIVEAFVLYKIYIFIDTFIEQNIIKLFKKNKVEK
jgi:undecaprenyl-diphosphatase